MRVLLDAHVSARAIGAALRDRGHDVVAITERDDLEGLDGRGVLALAADEERILVSFDVKDFAPLLREWAEAGWSHAGCVLVHGLDHREFGRLLAGLDRLFAERPDAEQWRDRTLVLPTGPAR